MSLVVNLLPDLRQARLKEQRQRRLATAISIIVAVSGVGILLLLFAFSVGQQVIMNDLTKKISTKEANIRNTVGVIGALTAQQRLDALSTVWTQRVYMSKFFEAYEQANPNDVTLNDLAIDSNNQLQVSGMAGSYKSVSKLAEAMMQENVTFGKDAKSVNQPYFTSVAIRSANSTDAGLSFAITASLSSEAVNGN